MKIGIDCSQVSGRMAGIGNYTYQLVKTLSEIDNANQYVLYPNFYGILLNRSGTGDFPVAKNFKIAFRRMPGLLSAVLWPPFMPRIFKEYMLGDVDVVHSTTFCAPRLRGKRKRLVVTIYDITAITHPECHRKLNAYHCARGIKKALEYADAIIAISNNTKNDLINHLKAPEELITVTHLAAGPDYYEVKDKVLLEKVRAKYKLPGKYVLFVGSLEPRKNVRSLLKSYARLSGKLRNEFSLVIAGAKGWLNSGMPDEVKKLNILENVFFAGYIEKEDISSVYTLAAAFVYPSLYEGFGLPILEAMACGVPVITSNTSSMPEVAGGAARLVPPTDIDELASALEAVLEEESLRKEMRLKGLKRAGEFSWEKCARETLDIYRKVVAAEKR